jgi:hypothetical protein
MIADLSLYGYGFSGGVCRASNIQIERKSAPVTEKSSGPGGLVFTPMGVPNATGISQPIPPNASIQNGLLNFTPTVTQPPVEALKVMPREVK